MPAASPATKPAAAAAATTSSGSNSSLLSLRILLSALQATLLLATAMLVFWLVFGVSLNSIRDLSKTHAEQVASKTAIAIGEQFAKVTSSVTMVQNVSALTSYEPFALSADTAGGASAWCTQWSSLLANGLEIASNVQLISARFTDWSIVAVHREATRLRSFCTFSDPSTYATNGYETFYGTILQEKDLTTGVLRTPLITEPGVFKPEPATFTSTIPTEPAKPNTLKQFAEPFGVGRTTGGGKRAILIPPQFAQSKLTSGNTVNYFLVPCGASLQNMTGGPSIGWFSLLITIDFLSYFLEQAITTPNSNALLIDSYLSIVGATDGVGKWLEVRDPTATEKSTGKYPSNCNVDLIGTGTNRKVGCRSDIPHLGWAPLVDVDQSVLLTTSRASTLTHTSDGTFIVGSARLSFHVHVYSPLNILSVIPENDVAGDIFTQRNINLGIVFACFIGAAILGFFLVRSLLHPLDEVAERMQIAARLKDDGSKMEDSKMSELLALQVAFMSMNKELMRLKGFVPQALLMEADDVDPQEEEEEQYGTISKDSDGNNRHSTNKNRTASSSRDHSRRNSNVDPHEMGSFGVSPSDRHHDVSIIATTATSTTAATGAPHSTSANANAAGGVTSSALSAQTRASSATVPVDARTRQSRFSESAISGQRLAVSATSLKSLRVTIGMVNLRHFNVVAREITPELLVRLVDSLATKAFDACKQHRGILDSFQGDHFVFSFNAAKSCVLGPQKASLAILQFSKELERCSTVARVKTMVQRCGRASAQVTNKLLHVSAGVASGHCTVGNLGSAEIKRFSIVGEAVSRATELEHLIRTHPRAGILEPQLPYAIAVTSRDAPDVEAACNVEYIAVRKLAHAATLAMQRAGGDFVAVARVLGEHRNEGEQDEWMYKLQNAMEQTRNIEVRNRAFLALERRDHDQYNQLFAESPDVPHDDMEEQLMTAESVE